MSLFTRAPHPAATIDEQAALRRELLRVVALADATQGQMLAGRLAVRATALRIRLEGDANGRVPMDDAAFRAAVDEAAALRAALQLALGGTDGPTTA